MTKNEQALIIEALNAATDYIHESLPTECDSARIHRILAVQAKLTDARILVRREDCDPR